MNFFVTGASGFIGRAFCTLAMTRGHRVLALSRREDGTLPKGVEVARGSLESTPWSQVRRFSPDAVLHLAWVATPGIYLTSLENEIWLETSKVWFRRAIDLGVAHIAGTGTCIEYAASTERLHETRSLLDPVFPYSRAKVALFEWLRDAGQESWSWFRLFYPYGPGEHFNRLSSSLIQQLSIGKSLTLRTPHSIKDYIYVDDVARAMCLALEARAAGAINVGTGQGVSILDLARKIALILRADESLVQMASELSVDPTPIVIAENERLCSIGWKPITSLDEGLERIVERLSAPNQ